MSEKNNRLIIIDGHSLIYRAHFAMYRQGMSSREGIPTGAIFGFINMLNKLESEFSPDHICVVFDSKGPTFRNEKYEEYKATRKPMPDELRTQIPIIKDLLGAMNIPMYEYPGYEGDDIAGTIANQMEAEGLEPIIVTGDKDLLQLVTDKVKVVYTLRGITNYRAYDMETVIDEEGMTPAQIVEFKALKGDTSDNIPGIPGIGDKTAKDLLAKYDDLQGVYDHIEEITKAKIKENLIKGKETAFMSRDLATIRLDAPVQVVAEDLVKEEPNFSELSEMYRKLNFNRFMRELRKEYGSEVDGEVIDEDSDVKTLKWEGPINIDDDIVNLIEALKQAEQDQNVVGIRVLDDGARKAVPKISEIQLAFYDFTGRSAGKIFVVSGESIPKVVAELGRLKLKLAGYDVKDSFYSIMRNGANLHKLTVAFDVEIAEYLLSPGNTGHDFANVVNRYTGGDVKKDDSLEPEVFFNEVYQVMDQQKELIQNDGLKGVHEDIELPLIPVMASMEADGFAVRAEVLNEFAKELDEEIEQVTGEIYDYAGRKFNISSPKQLGDVLFEDLKLPPGKKTKSGYSTAVEVLEKLQPEHPIIDKIMEYRKLTKLVSTYVRGLVPFVGDDGKIHAQFNQAATTTGRISSSNPNMQNLPIRDEYGSKVREAFVAETDEYVLVGADYSQIELRVMAHLSKDEALLESFREGKDIHAATAARVFGVSEDEVTPLQRSHAKAVNFGIIYGISDFGLSKQLDIPVPEASKYISSYFSEHPAVKDYMNSQVKMARSAGYVETLSGRRRKLNYSGNTFIQKANDRMAMNTPVQGTAADIIKKAMVRVYDALGGMKSRLILQIHDELIVEAHADELDAVKDMLKREMQNAFKLDVDLLVDIHEGRTMLDLK